MSVYVDTARRAFGRTKLSHMIADTIDELHAMADRIGVKRKWFQASPPASWPHYDVSDGKRVMAIRAGAVMSTTCDLVMQIRRMRDSATRWAK